LTEGYEQLKQARLPLKAFSILALAALAVVGVAGCGQDQPAAKKATTKAAPKASVKAPPAKPVWPLTGQEGQVVDRPALALKIENPPEARPQSGLDQADVVWEEIVEGGISRFVAVFHSQIPGSAGPVRSVRPMDGAILGATGGLLAFSGGQGRFIDLAKEAGLQVIGHDQGGQGFYRNPDRWGEHALYAYPEELLAQADDKHKSKPRGDFEFAKAADSATAVADGAPATKVDLVMSGLAKPSWAWDGGRWLRSEKGTPAQTPEGAQLGAANVVALSVQVGTAGGTDSAGSPIPDVQMVGSGRALVASGGKTIEATWEKAGVTDPVVLKDAKGNVVKLAPGNTWVELVPVEDGHWTVG
jgi:hypothetical protein